MAFEATKKEWCELYSFFRLLADGKVVLGTAEAKAGDTFWPVAMIQREEHDGTRQYYIEEVFEIVAQRVDSIFKANHKYSGKRSCRFFCSGQPDTGLCQRANR